ncbi:MAG: hypothetical protein QGG90_12460 [Nitrospinota bacterium]|jgi:hypothetical protein|nr:hypothetical protein [Nitrospinota bacterium]MDP6620233.1 hypothetical protein [Nitrospinota bacterium]HJM43810.1 hypothetical protein [Nitrospinota bacterium]
MARSESKPLDTGDAFPNLSWSLPDGGTINVRGDMGDGWKVVLIFRGYF